jgi:integrase
MINNKLVNKRVATGHLATSENLAKLMACAKPTFISKIDELIREGLSFGKFLTNAKEQINISSNDETVQDRDSKIKRFILPTFENKDIDKITPADIEDWQTALKKQGISVDLIRRSKALLRRVFDRAVVAGHITHNPIHGTANIREHRENQKEIYTKKEISMMLDGSDGRLNLFIRMFTMLSLRSNEIIFLKWSDIDWTNSRLKVSRAIRKNRVGDPKTGKRVTKIPMDLYSTLLKTFQERKKESSEYIFPTRSGEHYKDASSFNRKHFQPFLKKIGVEYKGMYELKHTGISLLIQGTGDVNFACSQAGHKDKKSTLDFYSKFLENDEILEKANKVFKF